MTLWAMSTTCNHSLEFVWLKKRALQKIQPSECTIKRVAQTDLGTRPLRFHRSCRFMACRDCGPLEALKALSIWQFGVRSGLVGRILPGFVSLHRDHCCKSRSLVKALERSRKPALNPSTLETS